MASEKERMSSNNSKTFEMLHTQKFKFITPGAEFYFHKIRPDHKCGLQTCSPNVKEISILSVQSHHIRI